MMVDLDIVVIDAVLDSTFFETFMAFVDAGRHETRQRGEGDRILYRFNRRLRVAQPCWGCSPTRRTD